MCWNTRQTASKDFPRQRLQVLTI